MIWDFSMSKLETYQEGLETCKAFLKLNNFPFPKYINGVAAHTANTWQTYGLYLPSEGPTGTVYVQVKKATQPVRTRGRIWSYPGYKVDRTAAGICAHETGHHVSKLCGERIAKAHNESEAMIKHERCCVGSYLPWRELLKESKPVSGYEPVHEEAFAETMRLFILNPQLLLLGRPERYRFLTEELKLKPVIKEGWKFVLHHAPDFIKEQAQKWSEGK